MSTVIVDIKHGKFPQLKVPAGTAVAWRNRDPVVHSAETLRDNANYFNAGPILPGAISTEISFNNIGTVHYLCRYHHGMTGTVEVTEDSSIEIGSNQGGHGPYFKHFHGFVTGGRSADALYMSHTPILSDPRHHFQIILKGSLIERNDIEAYNNLRNSEYGDGKVDIFHGHLSLPDIGSGKIVELPNATIAYDSPSAGKVAIPGTSEDGVRVRIDKVILFHQFELDKPYPDGLEYFVYGDDQDIFIDHVMDRAPGFHSIAKLKTAPEFWNPKSNDLMRIRVPEKKIIDLPPQTIQRASMVDNAFQLFWLPPAGIYRPAPQDPLIRRDGAEPVYEVVLEDGAISKIEISRFIHFDFKLLNYGVLILEAEEADQSGHADHSDDHGHQY